MLTIYSFTTEATEPTSTAAKAPSKCSSLGRVRINVACALRRSSAQELRSSLRNSAQFRPLCPARAILGAAVLYAGLTQASCGLAYMRFDGTDAAVADVGELLMQGRAGRDAAAGIWYEQLDQCRRLLELRPSVRNLAGQTWSEHCHPAVGDQWRARAWV